MFRFLVVALQKLGNIQKCRFGFGSEIICFSGLNSAFRIIFCMHSCDNFAPS